MLCIHFHIIFNTSSSQLSLWSMVYACFYQFLFFFSQFKIALYDWLWNTNVTLFLICSNKFILNAPIFCGFCIMFPHYCLEIRCIVHITAYANIYTNNSANIELQTIDWILYKWYGFHMKCYWFWIMHWSKKNIWILTTWTKLSVLPVIIESQIVQIRYFWKKATFG